MAWWKLKLSWRQTKAEVESSRNSGDRLVTNDTSDRWFLPEWFHRMNVPVRKLVTGFVKMPVNVTSYLIYALVLHMGSLKTRVLWHELWSLPRPMDWLFALWLAARLWLRYGFLCQ